MIQTKMTDYYKVLKPVKKPIYSHKHRYKIQSKMTDYYNK